MSRYFLITLPISGGKPQLPAALETAIANGRATSAREGGTFTLNEVPPDGTTGRPEMKSLTGRYLGRLDEGQFSTTSRPGVVVASGSKSALQWLRDKVADPDNGPYRFVSLETAWQVTGVRDWLKANGMPWVAGEFGPVPGSTYGRPTLPVVYCGQNHDPFAPIEE